MQEYSGEGIRQPKYPGQSNDSTLPVGPHHPASTKPQQGFGALGFGGFEGWKAEGFQGSGVPGFWVSRVQGSRVFQGLGGRV